MPSTNDRDSDAPPPQPAPTIWPITIAAGLTLLAWGTVTSPIFSAVGALLFLAGIGRGREHMGDSKEGSDERPRRRGPSR